MRVPAQVFPRSAGEVGLLLGALSCGLQQGLVLAILPSLQARLGLGTEALGQLIAPTYAGNLVGQALASRIADRDRTRVVLLTALLFSGAGTAFVFGTTSLLPVVVGRFLHGVGLGAFLPAARASTALANPAAEGRAIGRVEAASLAGLTIGPLAGAFLMSAPVAAGLAALYLAALALLGATRSVRAQRESAPYEEPSGLVLDSSRFRTGLLLTAGVSVTVGMFESLWARYLADKGASDQIVGVSFALVGLPLMFGLPLGGLLSDLYGPRRVGLAALSLGPIFLVGYGVAGTASAAIVVAVVHAAVDTVTIPAAGVLMARSVAASRAVWGQGAAAIVGAITAGAIALSAPLLYDSLGASATWRAAAALVVAVVGLGWWQLREPRRTPAARRS